MTDSHKKRIPRGYLQSKENVIGIMMGFIDYLGHYPTTTEINKELPSLVNLINKRDGPYGGWNKFKKFMGYSTDHSSDKLPHWRIKENGMGAMAGLVELLGRYPTYDEALKELRGLMSYVSNKDGPYGGWKKFREDMGYPDDGRASTGYWLDKNNGMGAMYGLIELLGRYPTTEEAVHNLKGLLSAITRKDGPYGGWWKFREEMGYPYEKKRPAGYWSDKNNGMGAMYGLIELLGRYPTWNEMEKGYKGLLNAIAQKDGPYGGWRKFREDMCQDWNILSGKLPNGYWTDKNNGMGAMYGLIELLGRYPKVNETNKMLGSLLGVIYNKNGPYGDWWKFKEDMGYSDSRLPSDYWLDKKNGIGAMAGMVEFLGHYPTSQEASKIISGLVSAISMKDGPYGGWTKFKDEMGYSGRVQSNYWLDKDNGMGAMAGVVEFVGHYPTPIEANKFVSGLVSTITKKRGPYHHGWKKFRKEMGYSDDDRVPGKYWLNKKNGFGAMYGLIEFLGHYPTDKEVLDNKLSVLRSIISKIDGPYGGWLNFKKEMGYSDENGRMPPNYWLDKNNGIDAMAGMVEFLGHYPTITEARKFVPSLVNVIVHKNGPYAGWSKFREEMGYQNFKLTTENFITLIDNDEHLREIVKVVGNDPITLADILAIRYADSMHRKDFIKFFEERHGLRKYMGEFATGINGWEDYENLARHTLPFDKEDKIRSILVKRGIEYFLKDLGTKPTNEEIQLKINQLEEKLFSMG